ncbi:MAG: ABC transporter substrate-binding protein [Chloroflexi bacterium]|nr:ABC transporter substrate-binding protein [Chloroflexota bacterium]
MSRIRMLVICLIVCALTSIIIPQPSKTTAQSGSDFPITIVDATGASVTIESLEAIVSGSGDVTEIIAALGYDDQLVGVDISSTYPEDLMDKYETIGFARRLAIEPIVALNPTVFFCTETCAPEAVLDQLREIGIPVVIIPDNEEAGLALPLQKIDMIAAALNAPEEGEALKERVQREIDWVRTATSNVDQRPYAMMLYFRGTRLQLVAGAGTPAQAIIQGAGAIDAASEIGVSGYIPLNPEILLTAYPDYVLLMEGGIEQIGGVEAIRNLQGMAQTPAGENDNFLVYDDQYLLGMATRTGQILMDLAAIFHPSMTWETEVEYPYTLTDATGTSITVQQPHPVTATDPAIVAIIGKLGYHPIDYTQRSSDTVILTTSSADWQALREAGRTVVVIDDALQIHEVAQALGVPGRGEALIARLQQE